MTQRSLTALRIGNFKAFADTQRIPLKPITLIFGPNSAGKSSVIHSIAFAHEAQFGRPKRDRSPLDVYKTEIGGVAIDLGGFAQFVHQHDTERVVELGAEFSVMAYLPDGDELKYLEVSVSCLVGTVAEHADAEDPRPIVPRLRVVGIAVDGEALLNSSYRHTGWSGKARLRIETLNVAHPEVRRMIAWAVEQTSADDPSITAAQLSDRISKRLPEALLNVDGLFRLELLAPGTTDQFGDKKPSSDAPTDSHSAELAFWTGLTTLVEELGGRLEDEYEYLEYLGPIRALPPRHFTPGDFEDSEWNAGGGKAWDRVCRDKSVREAVNDWLSKPEMKTPYRLKVRELVDPDDLESELMSEFYKERVKRKPMTALQRRELLTKELAEAYAELNERYEENQALADEAMKLVEKWMDRLELARSPAEREETLQEADAALEHWEQEVLERAGQPTDDEFAQGVINEDEAIDTAYIRAASFSQRLKATERVRKTPQLVLHDVTKKIDVSHRDVGTGISQVLPVLVAAYGSKDSLIAMEQPEIHLHPALQAELGDVFIESALGERGNVFILETHSEHLILRLLRRVREKKVQPDDLCVLFAEPTAHGTQIRRLEIDEDGDFIDDWPGGFFEESFREKFAGR